MRAAGSERRRRVGPGVVAWGTVALVFAACATPRGGWNVDGVLQRYPRIAEIPGQRLGDLTPFPALVGDEVILVACRFDASPPSIFVQGSGEDWPVEWAALAVSAVDRALAPVSLILTPERSKPASPPVGIHVRSLGDAAASGPRGLADTLSECLVSETGEADAPVRGRVRSAEVRIRRQRIDSAGRDREANAEEWIGAMVHELGHALGFQGHVVRGRALLQREQSELRSLGRDVIARKPIEAPSLSALFRLPQGARLGEVALSDRGERARLAASAAVAEETSRRGAPGGPWSIAGDDAARLVWRWPDGTEVWLHFPDWAEGLRWGRAQDARWARRSRSAEAAPTP